MLDVNVWTSHLIGRDRELAVLGSLLDGAAVDGATLLLTGEPGVGKTALLAAAAEMAATAGFEVIRAGGVEYETDVSFAGLHRLPRSSRVAMEVALGLGSGPAPERLAVLNASLALFRQAASRGPLLIVIDDLHWLDRASSAAVGFVGRRLRGSRIGLLGAIRPDVGGFFERAGLPEYEVAPLSEADAMGLLARQFVHLPTRVLRRVADEAQGNPLALLEFAASAGGPRDGGRRRTTVTSGMSREVRTLYDARIERLPEPTRRLLLHPMIKSVVVERSTHEERRKAHLRLAERLADQPERRGHHLAEAAFTPDEEIAAAVEDGAHRTLQRGDVVGAISRLLRAADLSPNPADRSRRLADAAYVGAHSAGQLDSASELLHDAHRRDPTLGEECHAHATAITSPGTFRSHSLQALWTALDLIDAAVHTGRDDEARAHAEAARRADLGRLSPRFALVTAAARAMVASDDEAPALFGAALALPGIEEWPFELARVRLAHGERLRRLRRTRDARSQLAAARDGFERLGAHPWARRAATELGATGATRQRVNGAGASLTLAEREVARLAATGMTNREIAARLYVAPRTVSAHLYRIFPKLGITSRAALRDALNAVPGDAAP